MTSVLSPVASTRTQPVTVTSPAGGSGTSAGSAAVLSVATQPRSTSTAVPVVGHQRHDRVDARGAVAGPVADDDGVLDVVGPGRLHDPPLVVLVDLATGRQHLVDRDDGGVLVALDDRVARLAVLEAAELPLAEPPRQPGQQRDDDREEDPPPRRQEPHRTPAAHRGRGYWGPPRPSSTARVRGERPVGCAGDHPRAPRPLRPGGDRPPGVADRPLQPALLLLHAGRGSRLAADRRGAHRRRGRPPDHDRRPAPRRPRRPLHRRRAAGAPGAGRHRRPHARARPRRRDLADHQRARPRAHGAGAQGRRPRPGQRQPRLGAARDVREDHPPRPARRRRRGPRRRPRGRAAAGEGQRRAAARRERRPGARAAPLGDRPRLRPALHRADAAGRPARLEPRGDGHRRRDLRAPRRRVRPDAGARAPRAPTRPSCSSSTAARPRSA